MKPEYCADALALYQGKLVLVERFKEPQGYALPGGRRNGLETAVDCVVREFKEETGLTFIIERGLGIYDAPGRDPRGPKIPAVFYGMASGEIRDEVGKTKVILLDLEQIDQYKEQFAFDHCQIVKDWQKKIEDFE